MTALSLYGLHLVPLLSLSVSALANTLDYKATPPAPPLARAFLYFRFQLYDFLTDDFPWSSPLKSDSKLFLPLLCPLWSPPYHPIYSLHNIHNYLQLTYSPFCLSPPVRRALYVYILSLYHCLSLNKYLLNKLIMNRWLNTIQKLYCSITDRLEILKAYYHICWLRKSSFCRWLICIHYLYICQNFTLRITHLKILHVLYPSSHVHTYTNQNQKGTCC